MALVCDLENKSIISWDCGLTWHSWVVLLFHVAFARAAVTWRFDWPGVSEMTHWHSWCLVLAVSWDEAVNSSTLPPPRGLCMRLGLLIARWLGSKEHSQHQSESCTSFNTQLWKLYRNIAAAFFWWRQVSGEAQIQSEEKQIGRSGQECATIFISPQLPATF